jgi:tetratricopeptide (TPR) repeat protein
VRARKVHDQDVWELVHPRCARDRVEDLEEVRKMLDAGEVDVAVDECRWLLQGCSDCLEAHRLLGEIALGENDLPLARGHFGYGYRLGAQALERAGSQGPAPYRLPANQGFLECAKGLAWCLKELGKAQMAEEVVAVALRCDPSDPLGVKKLLGERAGGT